MDRGGHQMRRLTDSSCRVPGPAVVPSLDVDALIFIPDCVFGFCGSLCVLSVSACASDAGSARSAAARRVLQSAGLKHRRWRHQLRHACRMLCAPWFGRRIAKTNQYVRCLWRICKPAMSKACKALGSRVWSRRQWLRLIQSNRK